MQTLTLIRGLPGSGKTTLAEWLSDGGHNARHFEADMFFTKQGIYQFDASKLREAHEWCQQETLSVLERGYESVIVSNTFTTLNEMRPYRAMAARLNIALQIYECKGSFGSIHNVPTEAIMRMASRWEDI